MKKYINELLEKHEHNLVNLEYIGNDSVRNLYVSVIEDLMEIRKQIQQEDD